MFEFDHIAMTAATLGEGVAIAEAALGVSMGAGGRHALMATHNRLLSLGPDCYFEVIAADPAAPAPGLRRWFGLDGYEGAPRLENWVCRTAAIGEAVAQAPVRYEAPLSVRRGDLAWRIALTGCEGWPALIEWEAEGAAGRLPEAGCRLRELAIFHPQADAIAGWLRLADPRVAILPGRFAIAARILTPSGERDLP